MSQENFSVVIYKSLVKDLEYFVIKFIQEYIFYLSKTKFSLRVLKSF